MVSLNPFSYRNEMEHPDGKTPAFNPYRKNPSVLDTLFGEKDGIIPVCIHNLEPIPFMHIYVPLI